MGWKNVKEHYRIGHYVQVTPEGVCIGSGYIHDLIVISQDGALKKRYDGSGSNTDLARYQDEIDKDPDRLRELVATPDVFEKAVVVYTYQRGEIIEKVCEVPGWPNVTHDGCMMYENTFSTDKSKVIAWAKRSAALEVEYLEETIADIERRLRECRATLMDATNAMDRLEAAYPSSATSLAERSAAQTSDVTGLAPEKERNHE